MELGSCRRFLELVCCIPEAALAVRKRRGYHHDNALAIPRPLTPGPAPSLAPPTTHPLSRPECTKKEHPKVSVQDISSVVFPLTPSAAAAAAAVTLEPHSVARGVQMSGLAGPLAVPDFKGLATWERLSRLGASGGPWRVKASRCIPEAALAVRKRRGYHHDNALAIPRPLTPGPAPSLAPPTTHPLSRPECTKKEHPKVSVQDISSVVFPLTPSAAAAAAAVTLEPHSVARGVQMSRISRTSGGARLQRPRYLGTALTAGCQRRPLARQKRAGQGASGGQRAPSLPDGYHSKLKRGSCGPFVLRFRSADCCSAFSRPARHPPITTPDPTPTPTTTLHCHKSGWPWISFFSHLGVRDYSQLTLDLTRNELIVGASYGVAQIPCLPARATMLKCRVGNMSHVLERVNGVARCPYDPRHNSTAVVTESGELYAATVIDFSGSGADVVLCDARPPGSTTVLPQSCSTAFSRRKKKVNRPMSYAEMKCGSGRQGEEGTGGEESKERGGGEWRRGRGGGGEKKRGDERKGGERRGEEDDLAREQVRQLRHELQLEKGKMGQQMKEMMERQNRRIREIWSSICSHTMMLNAEPHFISAYDIGLFTFFFLRENAVEHDCGKTVYSRVARVCKNDIGGRFLLEDTWTTFMKARLNCSRSGEIPFYYNELQSTFYLSEQDLIYGIFTTN
ncbi:hypothetical protein CRUP_014696, partial [Coryphaenoides rupestris]